jgi:hypothetical protein
MNNTYASDSEKRSFCSLEQLTLDATRLLPGMIKVTCTMEETFGSSNPLSDPLK